MSTSPEDLQIRALFEDEALPPRHDPAFIHAVAQRIARRRLIEELVGWGVMSLLTAMVLWAAGPVLAPFLKPAREVLTLLLPAVAVVTGVLIVAHPRTHAA